MSSHQVTLKDIVRKWSGMTTQSASNRWDEMQALFDEIREAGIPSSEVMKCKDHIIRIWVPLTWEEARKKYENWKEKSWWQDRKKATLKTYEKWFSELKKYEKDMGINQPAPKPTEEPSSDQAPIFDNLEDFRAWKARKAKQA
jgi:hypothetical protein